jgi:twitching motility protein PilU
MNTPAAFMYLTQMNEHGASDLYLTVGYPPTLRIENEMKPLRDEPLTPEEVTQIIGEVLTSRQQRDFEMNMELNSAIDMGPHGRFRVNAMRQRQMPGLVIRRIISKIPSFEELNLPPVLNSLALERRGLVLLTGMTGSGKSTTLASMLNVRNETEHGHIITIEDPIEYYHEHKKCVVTQREVGVDTSSFAVAMRNALRQRPDVILVGEIRDRDVMEQALTIAETGHLCLATLHTNNAYQAIERIVNFFPEEFHNQVRLNLSMNLKAIISQRLLPNLKGGMVPALEIMINEGLIRDLISEGRYEKITEIMEQNNSGGMRTFDQSLLDLYKKGLISEETAITQSDKPSDMKMKLRQSTMSEGNGDAFHKLDTSVLSVSD